MLHMERYRGHFFNWYNTRTLQAAEPRYVSSVDSGNLWGALTVLSAGLEEMRNRPLVPPRLLEGLQDAVEVIADLHRQAASSLWNDPVEACIAGLAHGVLRRALRGSAANLRAAPPHSLSGGRSGGLRFGRSTGLETMDVRAGATAPGPSTLVAIGVLDAVWPAGRRTAGGVGRDALGRRGDPQELVAKAAMNCGPSSLLPVGQTLVRPPIPRPVFFPLPLVRSQFTSGCRAA